MNPELRQTFNTISRNLESANEAAQVNIYDFTSHYIDPCLGGIKACVLDCTAACFPTVEDPLRRKRGRSRGRADFTFDFYDDWEEGEEETGHVVGWGNDELDSLLAGRGQPRAQRTMSYGARGKRTDPDSDPNLIPKSSYLGFLDRLPFKIGARGLRYMPSSAGLQENPGGLRIRDHETEHLAEDSTQHQHNGTKRSQGHARTRSQTAASQASTTSRSARSDLILSDEDDDAVPIDEEFASAMLSRRTTSSGADDLVSSRTGSGNGNRPILSRTSTRTTSSKSLHRDKTRRSSSKKMLQKLSSDPIASDDNAEPVSLSDLKREEAQLEQREELEITTNRLAARRLASATGLGQGETKTTKSPPMSESQPASPTRTPSRQFAVLHSPASPLNAIDDETEPFPDMSSTPKRSEVNDDPP